MFGDRLFVAPVMEESASGRTVPLPTGTWIDYRTGQSYTGPTSPYISSPLGTIPLFARGGSLLPIAPVRESSDDLELDTLIIESFPIESGLDEFTLYEDDGITLEYQSGSYSLLPMRATWSSGTHSITIGPRTGNFAGMIGSRTFLLSMRGVVLPPAAVAHNDIQLSAKVSLTDLRESSQGYFYDSANDQLWVQYTSDMGAEEVVTVAGYSLGSQIVTELPGRFDISHVYPNPFNSQARINITLPAEGSLTVKLFDITGRHVRTLLSERRPAGVQNLRIQALDLASGTYFVRAEFAGSTVQKKLTLIK
jgi:hypothetical protein